MRRDRPAPHWPGDTSTSAPLERLLLVALALGCAVAGLLWLAGELSARVVTGNWLTVSAGDMGSVLVRFPSHLGDPAAAWPEGPRRRLPGPVGYYAALLTATAPFVAGLILLARRRLVRGAGKASAATWGTTAELKPLRVAGSQPGRLTLGRVGGHLVATEPRQSVLVVGPTQTGKTTGLADPAVLEHAGPVVVASVKTDVLDDTIAARLERGDVYVYDPTGVTGAPSDGWTPLSHCTDWHGAQQMAAWLVGAARSERSSLQDDDFWYAATAKLLAPILLAAATTGETMATVLEWIDSADGGGVLGRLDRGGFREAALSFEASQNRDEKTRSSIYTTAETVLIAYADPRVLESATTSDFTPQRLLDGGRHTLYLCAPAHEQRRLRPLLTAVVQEIVAAVYDMAARSGGPIDPSLLLVLDECANIAPVADLATIASTGAGQGIQLVSVFQDLAQVAAVYGRDRASTIVSNHRAKVILTAIADQTTLDYVGRLLGDEEVRMTSSTSGGEGRQSTTESVGYRSLAPANVLRQMPPGHGVLVYGHLSPARLALRPWYRDRELTKLARPEGAR